MTEKSIPLKSTSEERATLQERRVAVRYRCASGTLSSWLRTDTDICLDATVLDLSRRGIGLAVNQAVTLGTIVGVELHSPTLRIPCFLLARVFHIREHNGRWILGCRLASRLPETELDALI